MAVILNNPVLINEITIERALCPFFFYAADIKIYSKELVICRGYYLYGDYQYH